MNRSDASTSSDFPASPRGGLTLVELLLTLAIISVLAAMLIPQFGLQVTDQLASVAEIVASDLDYARSLAVVNNSDYELTFEPDQNRYQLRHIGANTLLHVLPTSAFRQTDDLPDVQTTDLGDLPMAQPAVRLLGAVTEGGSAAAVDTVTFMPLGGTGDPPDPSDTVVWLACGSGTNERFISIRVNRVTGLVEIGSLLTELPAGVATLLNVAN
ncbi:MAG: prepilin-type N-terminal cleavage/methylation domain-containing protein [Pirellulaceae bacterium]